MYTAVLDNIVHVFLFMDVSISILFCRVLSVKSCYDRHPVCECEITLIIPFSLFFFICLFFFSFSLLIRTIRTAAVCLCQCLDSPTTYFIVCLFAIPHLRESKKKYTMKWMKWMNERQRMELSCQFCIYNTNKIITMNSE